MKLQRPRILMIERRDRAEFSLEDLLAGGAGLARRSAWVALAPHLGQEVEVELGDLEILSALGPDEQVDADRLARDFSAPRVDALVEAGLLISDAPAHAALRERERLLLETDWWAPAAIAHAFGRWSEVDVAADREANGRVTLQSLIEAHGLPPAEARAWRPREQWLPLSRPERTPLDDLLDARATCRNFMPDQAVPLTDLAAILSRVFGARAAQTLAPGAVMLKKTSPSGGGLHPIEAFVLARNVEGLPPGAYHYHAAEHVLEPLRMLDAVDAAAEAHRLVAGQAWFAGAPVIVLMAARFQRNFWKYRKHAKAWKVIQMDAGHLSQTLGLCATDAGYGAFVTAAINDASAEALFELDGLSVGAVACCGFGRRAATRETVEFDPLGRAVR